MRILILILGFKGLNRRGRWYAEGFFWPLIVETADLYVIGID